MGYALANASLRLGADVSLISGPTNQNISSKKLKLTNIKTAFEMYNALLDDFYSSDVVIMAAAVSDYKPKKFFKKKIKKNNKDLNIKFEKTLDILGELGKIKSSQILVGFALENENEISNAKSKLENKNLDLIILNSLNDEGAGFGFDTNKISVISKSDEIINYDLKDKSEVANDIFTQIIRLI